MTEKRTRRRKPPEQEAVDFINLGEDQSFLEGRFINDHKGMFFIHCTNVCVYLLVQCFLLARFGNHCSSVVVIKAQWLILSGFSPNIKNLWQPKNCKTAHKTIIAFFIQVF